MCPICGELLSGDDNFHYCSCGYAETTDMSYEEICNMFNCIEDSYANCPL